MTHLRKTADHILPRLRRPVITLAVTFSVLVLVPETFFTMQKYGFCERKFRFLTKAEVMHTGLEQMLKQSRIWVPPQTGIKSYSQIGYGSVDDFL